jgi:hypothetical protein
MLLLFAAAHGSFLRQRHGNWTGTNDELFYFQTRFRELQGSVADLVYHGQFAISLFQNSEYKSFAQNKYRMSLHPHAAETRDLNLPWNLSEHYVELDKLFQ